MARSHIFDMLHHRAISDGDAPAITAAGRKPLRYRALVEHVAATAAALSAAGIDPDDRVALVLRNGPEMATCFLAVASVAICAPLNPSYRAAEFATYFASLKPKALIIEADVDSVARQVANDQGITILELDPLPDEAAGRFTLRGTATTAVQPRFTDPDAIALLLRTSGTTAQAKIVPLAHKNLVGSALTIGDAFCLTSRDRCLNIMPLFHIHGLVGALLSSLGAGGSIVCTGGLETLRFFDWLREFAPSWYTAVPTMHLSILARAERTGETAEGHRLRFIRSCSAALPQRAMEDLEKLFGVPVLEAYGMTEAAHQVAANPLPPQNRKPRSVGRPTGTEIALMDERGELLGRGASGEIVVRGGGLMGGYVDNGAANRAAFRDGWFRTGDIGSFDADGYLFIHGRAKEIINRGGAKISPQEIENVLLGHPSVAEALAFAVPDPRLGDEVGACVVLRPNETIREHELCRFVATQLADFKVPRRLVFVDEIPKGATGKPQRIGLAEKLGLVGNRPGDRLVAATDAIHASTEQLLTAVWQRALKMDEIGRDDNFFDLGGDSLTATRLIVDIEHLTNIKLTLAALFEAPTIAQLAALIARDNVWGQLPRAIPIQPKGSRPPFFCVGGGPLFLPLARLLGPDQPFLGLLAPSDLKRATTLEEIARFHVKTIRAVQSHGPYFLGGWCLHGLIAYEIAQQLRQEGEEVALLALFDVLNPIRGEASWLAAIGRGANAVRRLFCHLAIIEASLRRRATRQWDVNETIQRLAGLAYQPRPYRGNIILFHRSDGLRRRDHATQLGWRNLIAGRLEAFEIPGDHRDMFREPSVALTASILSASLAGGEATPQAEMPSQKRVVARSDVASRPWMARAAAVIGAIISALGSFW